MKCRYWFLLTCLFIGLALFVTILSGVPLEEKIGTEMKTKIQNYSIVVRPWSISVLVNGVMQQARNRGLNNNFLWRYVWITCSAAMKLVPVTSLMHALPVCTWQAMQSHVILSHLRLPCWFWQNHMSREHSWRTLRPLCASVVLWIVLWHAAVTVAM